MEMGWKVVPVSGLSSTGVVCRNESQHHEECFKEISFFFIVTLLIDSFLTTFSLEKKKIITWHFGRYRICPFKINGLMFQTFLQLTSLLEQRLNCLIEDLSLRAFFACCLV